MSYILNLINVVWCKQIKKTFKHYKKKKKKIQGKMYFNLFKNNLYSKYHV